jgi:hypothetical protein
MVTHEDGRRPVQLAILYCSGVQWAPLQDHLLQAVVDPLRCIDIQPAWQLAMELVMLSGTTDREIDSDEEMTFH